MNNQPRDIAALR